MLANIRRMSCLSPYWSIAYFNTYRIRNTNEHKKVKWSKIQLKNTDQGVFDFCNLTINCVYCVRIDILDFFGCFSYGVIGICVFIVIVIVIESWRQEKKKTKVNKTSVYCRLQWVCVLFIEAMCACMITTSKKIYLQHWSKSYSKKDRQTHWEENIKAICMKPQ